jgi:hypothetical protein
MKNHTRSVVAMVALVAAVGCSTPHENGEPNVPQPNPHRRVYNIGSGTELIAVEDTARGVVCYLRDGGNPTAPSCVKVTP